MKTPDDYIGMEIKADVKKLPVVVVNKDADKKTVYCQRYEPLVLGSKEHEKFHLAGAGAYEIYVICLNTTIDSINHRIEQLQCSHHSHASHAAPAWLFPEGAMFDVEWDEIILSVRKRMLETLEAFICEPAKLKNTTIKLTKNAAKK